MPPDNLLVRTRHLFAAALLACAIIVADALTIHAAAQTRLDVDLELVLAVDISMSMDTDEQRLQRNGYVEAFRDQALHGAIASGQYKRVAVTYFEWAGQTVTRTLIPWTLIDSPAAARDFADRLSGQPISRERFTSISAALRYAAERLAASPYRGTRRIVDVSGDGPNNNGPPVAPERDALINAGVVINGLPILLKRATTSFDIADLETYYRDCVVGGDGAFVIPITTEPEFLSATRQKLLREIAGTAPSGVKLIRVGLHNVATSEADCFVGEKMWQRYMDRQRFEK